MTRKSVRSQKMSALTKRVHKGLGTGLGASFQEVSALVHCPLMKAAPYFPIKNTSSQYIRSFLQKKKRFIFST